MSTPEKKEDLLEEAKGRSKLLSECLPSRVDPVPMSPSPGIPFKVMVYREALYYRTEELARMSCEMYERNELATAITLTRACLETVAAMWYLKENIQKVIDKNDIGEINDTLMRLLHGSKNDLTPLEAINVLTFIKSISKNLDEFETNYKSLCEYAHPNWAGTAYLYSKNNTEEMWTDFGRNIRNTESVVIVGLVNLNTSLMLFEHSYNLVGDMLQELIKVCKKDAEK